MNGNIVLLFFYGTGIAFGGVPVLVGENYTTVLKFIIWLNQKIIFSARKAFHFLIRHGYA